MKLIFFIIRAFKITAKNTEYFLNKTPDSKKNHNKYKKPLHLKSGTTVEENSQNKNYLTTLNLLVTVWLLADTSTRKIPDSEKSISLSSSIF
jgi:hypothetical protein